MRKCSLLSTPVIPKPETPSPEETKKHITKKTILGKYYKGPDGPLNKDGITGANAGLTFVRTTNNQRKCSSAKIKKRVSVVRKKSSKWSARKHADSRQALLGFKTGSLRHLRRSRFNRRRSVAAIRRIELDRRIEAIKVHLRRASHLEKETKQEHRRVETAPKVERRSIGKSPRVEHRTNGRVTTFEHISTGRAPILKSRSNSPKHEYKSVAKSKKGDYRSTVISTNLECKSTNNSSKKEYKSVATSTKRKLRSIERSPKKEYSIGRKSHPKYIGITNKKTAIPVCIKTGADVLPERLMTPSANGETRSPTRRDSRPPALDEWLLKIKSSFIDTNDRLFGPSAMQEVMKNLRRNLRQNAKNNIPEET